MNFGIYRPSAGQAASVSNAANSSAGLPQNHIKVENEDRGHGQPLSDFILQLEDYNPTVPDAVIASYLNSAGFESSDPRIVRLIGVATQKFINDIANDALQHCRTRTNAPLQQTPVQNTVTLPLGGGAAKTHGKSNKDRKFTCTVDDVAPALADYGITVRKVHYFS